MKVLEMEIVQLQEQLQSNGHWTLIRGISEKKSKLDDLLEMKAKGALIRSRFQNVDQMDVPSTFFFFWPGEKKWSKKILSFIAIWIWDNVEWC